MKTGIKNIKANSANPLSAIPVNNDLKKYAHDPAVIRKKERAIELLMRIGRIK